MECQNCETARLFIILDKPEAATKVLCRTKAAREAFGGDLVACQKSNYEEGRNEVKSRNRNGVVNRLKQNTLLIQEPEGMGQQLIEVARADFDGDGIKDILLFEYCYATHGTLGFGGVTIITRKSADANFERTPRPNCFLSGLDP